MAGAAPAGGGETELSALEHEIRAREWYHTMELAPGVITPGWFDLREVVGQVPFPRGLENKRCLDIGTFDGFWAFEMERRGAREVLAIDIIDPLQWDWPIGSDPSVIAQIAQRKGSGDGFQIARRELGFSTERRELSIYDLDPGAVGTFDFVFIGSLLLHLRDPVRALESARSVCRGKLMLLDAVNPQIGRLLDRRPVAALDGIGRPWWWHPNARCLQTMLEAAGLRLLEGPAEVHMTRGPGQPVRVPRNPLRLLRAAGRYQARLALRGDPHAAFVTEPA